MRRARFAAAVLAATLATPGAFAGLPDAVPDLPVLGAETLVGAIVRSGAPAVAPTAKVADGDLSDWTGAPTRLGGSAIYSRGEYVYQDYINDAWGADDGFDADRLATLDAAREAEPRTYRVDALQQAAGAQFGAARPVGASLHYGDASPADAIRTQADILEARVAADASRIHVLVRTLNMAAAPSTAVLLLFDTATGGSYALPADAGGITTGAEYAILVSGTKTLRFYASGVSVPSLGCTLPCATPDVAVASNPAGYTNAVEISVSRALVPAPAATTRVGIATGIVDSPSAPSALATVRTGTGASNLLNAAFRREPARIWMDRAQALALHSGSYDAFLAPVRLDLLEAGATETFQMRPGYYEAIYQNAGSPVNFEGSTNEYFQGPFQHYGVYLPASYRPEARHPAMFWFHYRGGHAHDAAAWEPDILRHFGDETGSIVVTPSARGTSSWYTGRGMVDYLDVWNDAFARLRIEEDRVYMGGHSMGGWASYLLPLLFPDRWAAANPEDGLIVPGLWAGAGPPQQAQNGADLNAEFLYTILENARNVPYAILHGTADELVPVSSALAIGARFHQLGYRYRNYTFHAYEHYSAPIWDDWREMARYMWQFRRDPNPANVTYKLWPALNRAVSTISVPSGVDLGFGVDGAYWVSGLATRTAGTAPSNIGAFDGTTWGRGVPQVIGVPEAGTGGQPEPYTMHGQAHLPNGSLPAENRFRATLTNLATATLDLGRMALSTAEPISASVTTDGATTLRLRGSWTSAPGVSGAAGFSYDGSVLSISLAAGTSSLTIQGS